MKYWLFKTEPSVYGIEDLKSKPDQTDHWDGVRNYQARNMMRDEMQIGDLAFFYHSNCKAPGIVGTIEVVKTGYPDHTAFDSKEKYYDPKSDIAKPRWYMVDVKYKSTLKRVITLSELKDQTFLNNMPLVRKGNRLSVMPISSDEWMYILSIESTRA